MMRIIRLALAALAAILVAGGIATVLVERSRSPTVMGEEIPPDEDVDTAKIVASAIQSVNQPPQAHPPYRRDVHAKAHGCVRAIVEVDPQLPAAYRQGVFAEPGTQYRSWIRFSNGDTQAQPDGVDDARGMALKLTGVAGQKLLEGQQDADTQDFIMINSSVFFIRNVAEYAKFARLLADGSRFGYFFDGWGWNPLRWHLRDMWLAWRTLKAAPASLLHAQFYSLSAYKLGDANIKFSARGCTRQPVASVDRRHPNFLREEMQAELKAGEACFDLMVQPQVAGAFMPVEDPTVEWSERDSPFVKAATVRIPAQEFDTDPQNRFCESLSFSPWHALPAHRPIGGLNRIRRAVYLEDARYRRARMSGSANTPFTGLTEPRGWCLDLSGATCEPPSAR
jgi:catalase